MSADYYSRIEQQRGPNPSEQMLAAIARGLHLSLAERDHLFRLGGHAGPARHPRTDHISPGIMRILDRLEDTPAQVMSAYGETLRQTRTAVALLGDDTRWTGLERHMVYRWFTAPAAREIYPAEDHPKHGRIFAAQLRSAYARDGGRGRGHRRGAARGEPRLRRHLGGPRGRHHPHRPETHPAPAASAGSPASASRPPAACCSEDPGPGPPAAGGPLGQAVRRRRVNGSASDGGV